MTTPPIPEVAAWEAKTVDMRATPGAVWWMPAVQAGDDLARRVERYEAALREIADLPPYGSTLTSDRARRIARDALARPEGASA